MQNNDARLETREEINKNELIGCPIEVALLNFLIENSVSINEKLTQKFNEIKLKVPFCSIRKCMTVVQKIEDEKVRIVMKGAPEVVIPCCT